MFLVPEWAAPAGVRAVMTTRRGGVSVAPWESLNLGVHVGDSTAAVLENRRRVRVEANLPSEPAWLEQVHGTAVIKLDDSHIASAQPGASGMHAIGVQAASPAARVPLTSEPSALPMRPRADAAVTSSAGVVCAIQVADCMPVLFAARDGSVVGATHAGWRGLAGGVLEATVATMNVPASELVAWLGPAIGPHRFEVGDDVMEAFTRGAGADRLAQTRAAFVGKSPGKWLCDLYALARLRLQAIGISQVSGGGWCTVADAERFYSYRRDGQTGRMAALIWLDSSRA